LIIDKRKGNRIFRLRKASFKGNGLQQGMAGASWDHVREKIYQARGG